MTTDPRSREAAYADLVTGLIDARVDVASERFDAELEAAEASGRLDPATARLLRWWQRESVRGVSEHARATVPAALVSLERAATEARDAVNRADAAWTTARGVGARAMYGDQTVDLTRTPPTMTPATTPPPAAPAPVDPPPVETYESYESYEPPLPPMPPMLPPLPSIPSAPVAPPPPPPVSMTPAPWTPEPIAPVPPAVTTMPPAPPVSQSPTPPLPDYLASVTPVALPSDPTGESVRDANGSTPPAPPAPPAPPTGSSDAATPPQLGASPGATPDVGRRRTLLAGLTVLPPSE